MVTKEGMPPARKFPAGMPPLPGNRERAQASQAKAMAPAQAEQDALVQEGKARLLENFKWMLSNSRCVERAVDLTRFAMLCTFCEVRTEAAGRTKYLFVLTSDGGKYRVYDLEGNMRSIEKFGIHVSTLEVQGECNYLYKDDPRRPWED